jgi:flagellar basal body rod protein FlgB
MNLPSLITDNIAELLVKIIEFTQTRQKLLCRNINSLHNPGFVPRDLPVDEFSRLLNAAIDEHIRSERLLLCDTENIKFGASGTFLMKPIVDKCSHDLLEQNPDEYLELQVNKLLENSLNQRIAAELLRQKEGTISSLE